MRGHGLVLDVRGKKRHRTWREVATSVPWRRGKKGRRGRKRRGMGQKGRGRRGKGRRRGRRRGRRGYELGKGQLAGQLCDVDLLPLLHVRDAAVVVLIGGPARLQDGAVRRGLHHLIALLRIQAQTRVSVPAAHAHGRVGEPVRVEALRARVARPSLVPARSEAVVGRVRTRLRSREGGRARSTWDRRRRRGR